MSWEKCESSVQKLKKSKREIALILKLIASPEVETAENPPAAVPAAPAAELSRVKRQGPRLNFRLLPPVWYLAGYVSGTQLTNKLAQQHLWINSRLTFMSLESDIVRARDYKPKGQLSSVCVYVYVSVHMCALCALEINNGLQRANLLLSVLHFLCVMCASLTTVIELNCSHVWLLMP